MGRKKIKNMKEEIVNQKIYEGLTFVSFREEDDGSGTIVFDIDKEFKKEFCKLHNMKRWSDNKFRKWIIKSLEEQLKKKDALEI